ncbi:MAG: GDSL-type esterase/lipase family protein [Bacteroidota bacterium]
MAGFADTGNVVDVTPTDEALHYMGRWDMANPARPAAGWQGASITMNFTGQALSVTLAAGTATEYFRVVLDDDTAGSHKIAVTANKATYQIATSLSAGPHKVEVIKETYEGTNATFFGFSITGANAGTLPPPAPPTRRIEFYGDSNLAGQSLESEEDEAYTSLRGSFFGYAGITARMFDASYHNISASGETISSLHEKYNQTDWWDASALWDFDRYRPDVVVVNLGANDVGKPKAEIKQDYHNFLDALRTVHPQAHIMLFNAFGWDKNEPANYTHEVIAERNDANMSSTIFPWVFEQFHGSEYDHAGMANVLATHLSGVMGWTSAASDVVSGFGLNGDVANGSFEEAAPFGGFAWRYANQKGVKRINNPANAYDGNYAIRLSQRASIHQPNPASNGDNVTVTLWLRGGKKGDKAKLDISFRNQQIYSDPLESTTQTVSLSRSWQTYTISATAPTTDEAVYNTRITISAAGRKDVVNVDAVSMSINGSTGSFIVPFERDASFNTPSLAPLTFALNPAYPNPFSNRTTISYTLAEDAQVRLEVFDVLGRSVATLVDHYQPATKYQLEFEADTLPQGIYFYRLSADEYTATRLLHVKK